MSYLVIGPAFRKIETQAELRRRLERKRLDARRHHSCETQYRRARFRDVLALRRMHAAIAEARKTAISRPAVILAEVAAKHDFTIAQMLSPSRKQSVAHARFEAAYRLRVERGMSLAQIRGMLGKGDHTTILNAIRRHAAMHGLPLP